MSVKNKTGLIDSRRIYGDTMYVGKALTSSHQDYDQVSAVQNFAFGTKMIKGERVFYYAKAGNTLIPDNGCKFGYPQAVMNNNVANAAIGATSVSITVGGGDGALSNGNIAANELVGGWMIIYPSTPNQTMFRKIIGNTAVTGGGSMTVTLDRPLTSACAGGTGKGECMHSMFANVIYQAGNFNTPVVGVAQALATVGQYLWLQTWGPCWLTPQATLGVGRLKSAIFREDGSLSPNSITDPTYNPDIQAAGFVMAESSTGTQGAPFVMLQITP